MADMKDFIGAFGDFETMAHDVDLKNFVFCSYGPAGEIEMYKMIVGYTVLPYDILLHVIDVESTPADFTVESHVEKEGVQFVFLKDFIGQYGVDIHPDFQLRPDAAEEDTFD